MPRNRADRSRETKRDEIAAAAQDRLQQGGYDGLSVSALARELGVAQNSIYWYFPSKDHLFVAALERMLAAVAATKPGADVEVEDRILWFTDRLAPIWPHSEALHRRRDESDVVADLATRLDAVIGTMLANALGGRVDEADLGLACETLRTVVEGAYVRRLAEADRHRILRYVLASITRSSWPPEPDNG